MCSEINSHHKTHTHIFFWLCSCLFSPLTCSWERQALAMNRWTEQTAMLSSLISEKTVKKGAPFSHTLSLFHLFVHLSVSIHRQEDQTKPLMAFPFTFRSPPPLLLSPFSCIHLLFSLLPIYVWQLHWHALVLLLHFYFSFFSSNISIHWLPLLFHSVILCLAKLLTTQSAYSVSSFFFFTSSTRAPCLHSSSSILLSVTRLIAFLIILIHFYAKTS